VVEIRFVLNNKVQNTKYLDKKTKQSQLSLLSTASFTTVVTVEAVSTIGTNLNHPEPFKLSSILYRFHSLKAPGGS